MDKNLLRSVDLLKENEEKIRNDAENALLTVCQNILSHPNEKKYREVRLDHPLVTTKLLPALGGIECLFDIGFVETTDCLTLPQEAPLSKLQSLQKLLSKSSFTKTYVTKDPALYNLIPSTFTVEESRFYKSIIDNFQKVLQYEDASLQEKAKKVIPIVDLEIATMTRLRQLHKHVKLNQTAPEKSVKKRYSEDDIDDVKDIFLMELLHWFKYKFFTWVDSPKCTACFSDCKHQSTVPSDDPRCSQIEIHRCTKCGTRVKFPRYIDPEPLLTLRRGRCGEWVNVFTLLCRTLGYDARCVHDETDHVWTEVWSIHEKRWIHLDPCEDVMDRPLMYEKGWKKKLTYIIAYSKDEVQDVTWRYTRNILGVLRRRDISCESKLIRFIESLNKYHQSSPNYSAIRRQYVIKRRLLELIELIHVPNKQNFNDNGNYGGRSTGSYEWRLARGEISESKPKINYSWDVSNYGEAFHLQYSIVNDVYMITDNSGKALMDISGWQNGTNEIEGGMFRKEEHDWKVTYLSRSPGATSGKVKWCFVVTKPNLYVRTFHLQATIKIFHEANVSWEVEAIFNNANQNKSVVLPISDVSDYHTDQLKGAVKLILTVTVSGGQGNCAWQHAQIFRQSLESKDDKSLVINIELENR
ncbi:peptide-N(4)-(N-acetyl-beta-glucosaminyl)asparagine amidase [Bombus pyrosoma]|uniref:peptide-N(4)-(N-acetyl-beta- glucosaminyl)asparagine amidase n=1 Tax=Bombus pyrosoma TaxID=396416 RepID=UPI001CB98F33|nr:peptide-N(4)-(N-acetyl-beta-glucosaminyl)asparagine amidase [Bombus pyrosoma]XP_043588130.1 peptide-N(4)-(N-acetyl-beta-glucosaminyl)asparagine amidase [Bombus pyrosoma]XP_043588131.1 peptide-N(4)-(N-acetyl-beta-glucosaminyl)asparagine amidase [Bombus pyrosoma]